MKRERGRRLPEHHPVGLDVWEVVEHEPGDRDRAEIIGRRRLPRDELGGSHLIRQWDEGQEPAGLVLLLPETEEMVDALLDRLDVAVEHGGVGPDPKRVRDAVDLAPASRIGLAAVLEQLAQTG